MSERGAKRDAGAPFYAPLRRKTSAEIISEARAAIYGEMNGTSNTGDGGGGVVGQSGGLRALRTRRPYTPREPQRSLFTERTRKKDNRPPSGFDYSGKFLSLSESGEENLVTLDSRLANLNEDALEDTLADTHNHKKKSQIRMVPRPSQSQSMERVGDSWSGFPKLPHLSGRSKPLHRRNTTGHSHGDNVKAEAALAQSICVIRPLGDGEGNNVKSSSAEINTKRSHFSGGGKSVSCDAAAGGGFKDISVKHLAVQMPNTSNELYDNMSLLELSEELSRCTRGTERTLNLIEAATHCIESSAGPPGGSLRDLLARALFSHAEHHDDEVLVAVARALLTMRVTGSHLAATCKLVFKIAKNDKNDHFFRDTNLLELLVEGCGRAEPVRESACCVYGCGALRVLALEPALAARATRAGALHLAALHLKIINNYKSENPRLVDDQCTHALYQVTGALRSLASVVEEYADEFVSSGALRELVAALTLHTDRDVLTNVARCLSVVSGWAQCCAALCACAGAARGVVRALAACGARAALAVRLAYTLGNMAADDERARNDIYNEEGSIDVLLTILESYTARSAQGTKEVEQDPDTHLIDTDLGGSDGSDEDVLIKTVRVVANLCLSERAGRGVTDAHADRTVRALFACLQLAGNIVQREMSNAESASVVCMERAEELATAALATLNNVTFYREPPDPPDTLHIHYDNICKLTCRWLRERGVASASSCEAVRALGNMSRATRSAQLIVLEGVLDTLEPFLMHESVSVRCAAAGVLVNVCGAGGGGAGGGAGGSAGRGGGGAGCAGGGAAQVAARALVWCAARGDPAPAPLLARALWNAYSHHQHPLEPAQASRVAAALALFIDDESVFEGCQVSNIVEQRTTDESIPKNHVTFEVEERADECADKNDEGSGGGEGELSDLGYEEGEAEECPCASCSRLAHWEQLVAVAVPLLDRMKPSRCDAAVGTD